MEILVILILQLCFRYIVNIMIETSTDRASYGDLVR